MFVEHLRTVAAIPIYSLFNSDGSANLVNVIESRLCSVPMIFMRDYASSSPMMAFGAGYFASLTNEPSVDDVIVIELDMTPDDTDVRRLLELIIGIRGHQDSLFWDSEWRQDLTRKGALYVDRSGMVAVGEVG